jgi:hypothetical protein
MPKEGMNVFVCLGLCKTADGPKRRGEIGGTKGKGGKGYEY